jgi:hypothetical protein
MAMDPEDDRRANLQMNVGSASLNRRSQNLMKEFHEIRLTNLTQGPTKF